MFDAYSQSTQHARAVAWLEQRPPTVWSDAEADAAAQGGFDSTGWQPRVHLAGLHVSLRSLRRHVALLLARVTDVGAPRLSVRQSPAGR